MYICGETMLVVWTLASTILVAGAARNTEENFVEHLGNTKEHLVEHLANTEEHLVEHLRNIEEYLVEHQGNIGGHIVAREHLVARRDVRNMKEHLVDRRDVRDMKEHVVARRDVRNMKEHMVDRRAVSNTVEHVVARRAVRHTEEHVVARRAVRHTEEHMVAGCRSVELSCPRDSLLVVTHATFNQNRMVASSCLEGLKDSGSILEQRSVLWAVVARCSGTRGSTCTFDIQTDIPQARDWGRGMIEVRYSCEKDVSSYCGGILTVSAPGYVSSPAYPKYYLGGRDCIWTLTAGRGQRIEVAVLDLSLRSDTGPRCEDSVRVAENKRILMDLCGQLDTPRAVISDGEEVEVRMRTAASRQQLYPRRGMLLRYTPLGCATPPAPADGIIKARNQTHLDLACQQGHVFVSTLSSQITLFCSDYKWSSWPMEHCVSVSFLMQYGNQSIVSSLMASHAQLSRQQLEYTLSRRGEWGIEVVATVIVGILLVASLALALLLFVRHRHMDRDWQDDRVNLNESRTVENIPGTLQKY